MKPYHYTECGLENVYLHNVNVLNDVKGEETICIPKINQLHKVIAQALITKPGVLSGTEIKFLRTELGYNQSDFSELLGKEAQACGRWERNEHPLDKTTNILICNLTATLLQLTLDFGDAAKLCKQKSGSFKINIDGADIKDKGYELLNVA